MGWASGSWRAHSCEEEPVIFHAVWLGVARSWQRWLGPYLGSHSGGAQAWNLWLVCLRPMQYFFSPWRWKGYYSTHSPLPSIPSPPGAFVTCKLLQGPFYLSGESTSKESAHLPIQPQLRVLKYTLRRQLDGFLRNVLTFTLSWFFPPSWLLCVL